MENQSGQDKLSLTGVFGKEAANVLRGVDKFRKQWTKTSVSFFFGLLGVAGSIIGYLYLDQQKLQTRVVVLETQIVPDLKLAEKVGDHESRISTLEGEYNTAYQHAGDSPTAGKRKK